MKKAVVLIILSSIALIGSKSVDWITLQYPSYWPKPLYHFENNPLNEKTIQLGKTLFYDPLLSRNNSISCESCHSPYSSFAHIDHPLSHGIDNKIGTRNAPALINLAWNKFFMWDGSINHLDMQPLGPISNPIEMDESINHIAYKLQHEKGYPMLFYQSFGDSTITGEHILKALSQFMLTLVSSNSKYDSVMRHESNFNKQEANGYKLFKESCASCHTEPFFTNQKFENIGLPIDTNLNDYGRMNITHDPKDANRFKVPTLRNIEYTYPYMHDGRFTTLTQVMNHYVSDVEDQKTLSKELIKKPVQLTPNERVDVIAFMLTLSDKSFIYNYEHGYPKK